MRCLMIDVAQTSMAAGAACAIAQVTGVNDNMSQSHYHDYFELYFLDSGERYHLMDDKLFKLQAGDCILFPPQTMHRSYGDQDMAFSRVVLYFRPKTITSADLLHKLLHSQVVYRPDSQELHQLRRIIYAMEEEQHSHLDCHDECMQSLLNLIMVQLLRMNQESTGILRETRVTKVIQYIHNHYAEDITLKDLSERFYVSEYYLCREFKEKYQAHDRGVYQADPHHERQTALHGNGPECHRSRQRNRVFNLTHFNRVFREVADVTPSEYRKRCQELHR